jgi:hypothetical protein
LLLSHPNANENKKNSKIKKNLRMIAAKFSIIFAFLTFHSLKNNHYWSKDVANTKQSAPYITNPLQYLNYRYRQEPFSFKHTNMNDNLIKWLTLTCSSIKSKDFKRLNELIEHLNYFLAILFVAMVCRVFKKAFSASF